MTFPNPLVFDKVANFIVNSDGQAGLNVVLSDEIVHANDQEVGVDYLHLLIVSMDYLIRQYNIKARLAITVHDEIRYLIVNSDGQAGLNVVLSDEIVHANDQEVKIINTRRLVPYFHSK
jgi:hypothetical protein